MRIGQARTVFVKELLETLRDKRTLMVMILGPVLIYPVLILALVSMSQAQQGRLERERSSVLLTGGGASPRLTNRLLADRQISVGAPNADADLRQLVRDGEAHAALIVSRDVAVPPDAPAGSARHELARVTVIYDEADERSTLALERINTVLAKFSREALTATQVVLADDEQFAYPLIIKRESVGTPEDVGRRILAFAIPMMLVLMTIAGSMYPAIDTTAGEKERGTIETVLTTPAAISEIVCGKFLTVFLIAMTTGLLNLAGMGVSLAAIGSTAQKSINLSLPLDIAGLMMLFIVPLAFLFSSVMMAVAMYARTVKEAQNYATPIYLLSVLPAMMSTLPGFELTPLLSVVPVVGVTLLLKELLQGAMVPSHLALVFISTSLYALVALRLTIRLFHDENVLFSSERPFALFVGRQRLKPRPVPTPGEALLLTAVCFVLFFTLGQIIQAKGLRVGFAVTMWVLVFLPPLASARYLKLDVRRTFSLRAPSIVALVGTAVAAAASLVVVLEIEYVHFTLLPYSREMAEQMERVFEEAGFGFIEMLVFIALFPAICEETLFRGFILSGLALRMRRWQAAIVVGVLFGFIHIGPVVIKVIPVSHILVGIILSLLVAYSRSIFTGMLFHFMYNGAFLAISHFEGDITAFLDEAGLGGLWLKTEGHVPAVLLVPAVVLLVGALAMVIGWGGKRASA